jgi:hypothetical protein
LVALVHLLARQTAHEVIASNVRLCQAPEGIVSKTRQAALDPSDDKRGSIR